MFNKLLGVELDEFGIDSPICVDMRSLSLLREPSILQKKYFRANKIEVSLVLIRYALHRFWT